MRQLKETGWIHHLARHAVACFLTRGDLWLPWTEGARVFDRDLLDADWAVNNFNWLGLAGVASWSPPFFRVYSPVPNHKQSSLNVDDAAGAYVDRFVPELRKLPAKYKYAPWTAPAAVLAAAGVVLGDTYPRPLVDHKVQSKDNIARFKEAQQRNRANKPKPPPKGAPKTKKQKV
jgi:cryptochrome